MKKLPFLLLILLWSCTLEDSTPGIDVNKIIIFDHTEELNVPANGVTPLTIRVKLGDDVSGEQSVTFRTDQGKFQNAADATGKTVTVTTSLKTATAVLIPDTKPNPAVGVSASVTSGTNTFSITRQVDFTTAFPAQMYINTDKQVLVPDRASTATLSLSAFRDPGEGKVSDEITVAITTSVPDTSTVKVDVVPFVKLSAEAATFTIRSANDGTGPVTVTATVTTEAGSVKAERIIEFKN